MNWSQYHQMLLNQFLDADSDIFNQTDQIKFSTPTLSLEPLLNQKTRRKINPAFFNLSIENPIFQHIVADKAGDISRTWNVGVASNVATMPMLAGGGPGLAAKIIASLGLTFIIGGYLNTLDTYRDLFHFISSGEIHGHKIVGQSHH